MTAHNWVYFGTFIICLLPYTYILGGPLNGEAMSAYDTSIAWATACGLLIAAMVTLLLVKGGGLSRVAKLIPVIPLVCIGVHPLSWILNVGPETFELFGGIHSHWGVFANALLIGLALAVIGALLVSRLYSEIRAGLDGRFVMGLFYALTTFAFIGLCGLATAVDATSTRLLHHALTLVCFVVVGVYIAIHISRQPVSAPAASDRQPQEALRFLAEHHRLSRREREILAYLVQGRGAPYIAEQEIISLNTVKTHVKRIYAKVGVHGREELLDAVHGQRHP